MLLRIRTKSVGPEKRWSDSSHYQCSSGRVDCPRTRIDFRSLTLFEGEESGDTHMAMYATVRDSGGTTIGQAREVEHAAR